MGGWVGIMLVVVAQRRVSRVGKMKNKCSGDRSGRFSMEIKGSLPAIYILSFGYIDGSVATFYVQVGCYLPTYLPIVPTSYHQYFGSMTYRLPIGYPHCPLYRHLSNPLVILCSLCADRVSHACPSSLQS